MFPVTDSSGTVIDCLMFEAQTAGVRLFARKGIERAEKSGDAFELTLSDGSAMSCDRLLLATGGARTGYLRLRRAGADPSGWERAPSMPTAAPTSSCIPMCSRRSDS